MKDYKQALALATILTASSNLAWAEDDFNFDPFFEFLIFGGISTVDGQDSTLQVTPSETDSLVQTNNGNWDAWTGQVGIGYVYPITNELETDDVLWFPIITPQINLYYLGNADISGDVYRYGYKNEMDYTMDFDSTRLMFDLGLTIAALDRFSLYALGGLGIAWNRIGYQATEKMGVDCPISSLDVHSHTKSGFAYEFGGGITFAGTDRVAISLEYLYAGLTDVKLGHDTDSEYDLHGSNFDIDTQSVLLGLRFAL